MIDRNRPPRSRPGWRQEYREGCQGVCTAATCPWFGNCKGEETPHWREVRVAQIIKGNFESEGLTIGDKRAMALNDWLSERDGKATVHEIKAEMTRLRQIMPSPEDQDAH